jgi:hypothetical protein
MLVYSIYDNLCQQSDNHHLKHAHLVYNFEHDRLVHI